MSFKADKPNMKETKRHIKKKKIKDNRDPCIDSNLNVT